MLSIFSPMRKRLSAYLKYQEIRTDNAAFRLHCVLTAVVLVTSSLLLTTTQLVGKPIECISDAEDWHQAVETFCWVTTTFTMPDWKYRKAKEQSSSIISSLNSLSDLILMGTDLERQRLRPKLQGGDKIESSAYPGVMPESDSEQGKKYYTYYQWVCFVLFFQAIMCYLPKVLWDLCESGRLSRLATGLNSFCGKEEKEKKTEAIICYLLKYRRTHMIYALAYWGCELLCLVNVLLQMGLMDYFLDGQFWTYGTEVLQQAQLPQHDRFDSMIYIFPRMTKCTFYYYGPSGGIVNLDSLCVLPQNLINEKVYIFLWFWYIILAVIFGLLVLYRVTIILMPRVRPQLLAVASRTRKTEDMIAVTADLDFGDWWLLYVLAKNMNPLVYRELISQFAERTGKSKGLLHKNMADSEKPLLPFKTDIHNVP